MWTKMRVGDRLADQQIDCLNSSLLLAITMMRAFPTCKGLGVAPPKLCFGLLHCCLKRYVARRQLVSAEYAPWQAELQPVVNIIFNNVQVFFLIANIGSPAWPEAFKEALNVGLLMVMSAESLRPSCVAPIGSEGRWYLIFAAPFALQEVETLKTRLSEKLGQQEAQELVKGVEEWLKEPFLSPYPRSAQCRHRLESSQKKESPETKRRAKQLPTREVWKKKEKEKEEKEKEEKEKEKEEQEPQPLHKA
eukprot:Skav213036  [mRNA]  locus=scaffold844:327012:334070:+ [translate_table: standard]